MLAPLDVFGFACAYVCAAHKSSRRGHTYANTKLAVPCSRLACHIMHSKQTQNTTVITFLFFIPNIIGCSFFYKEHGVFVRVRAHASIL